MSGSGLRQLLSAICGAALLSLSACYGGPDSEPGPAVMRPIPALGQTGYEGFRSDTYALRPSDVISISVFREPDLTLGSIPISSTGSISMPILGPIEVVGLTAAELETRLEEMLGASVLRYPEVTVNVVQYGSHLVTVEGSVNGPGIFNFSPGTRLSGALAMAGGPSRVAEYDDIAVFRQTPEGIAIAKFEYGPLQSGTMMDPLLEPGDRVVVGLNNLAAYWQDIISTLPTFGFLRWVVF